MHVARVTVKPVRYDPDLGFGHVARFQASRIKHSLSGTMCLVLRDFATKSVDRIVHVVVLVLTTVVWQNSCVI